MHIEKFISQYMDEEAEKVQRVDMMPKKLHDKVAREVKST